MKTGISVAIRRFIEQNIVADDPYTDRSWLDQQDMPRVQHPPKTAVSGLPVEPLPPLLGSQSGHARHPQRLPRRIRSHDATARRRDGS
ncbi:hypothetical protein [Arthrobacter sp. NPDC056493]|uniref:hypothetical protein n=1 Tax=Arthrobacter sp. NPDC056493 TaxID=3345839 RepID=UPI003670E6D9